MGDNPENDVPVSAETVERWKELLRRHAPTSYRELFPKFLWSLPGAPHVDIECP
jgi:hypothetical protein